MSDAKFRPTKKQLEFLDWEFGTFFHFGIRTFNEHHRDWDMKTMEASSFNPTELDCEQWIKTVKNAGVKYAVMTTKHHDGFALWPSKYTEYSVKNSPWKDGKGDVVKEYTDACRKYGLKVGLYYSCAQFDTTDMGCSYNDFVIGQLTELLTNYGKIDYMWFDACGYETIDFDLERITKTVTELAPDMLVFGALGKTTVAWSKNEWCLMNLPNSNQTEKGFMPSEADGCMLRYKRENFWFYNETHNNCRRTLDELLGMYYYTVGRGANLLLNIAPDRRGLIEDEDIRLLNALHNEITRRMHACALISETYDYEKDGAKYFETTFEKQTLVDHLVIEEDITEGNKIRKFSVLMSTAPKSKDHIYLTSGYTIGHKCICTFPPVRAMSFVVRLDDADDDAVITKMTPLYVGTPNLSTENVVG